MFIFFLTIDKNTGVIKFNSYSQSLISLWVGIMQTTIAGIVVLSYYIEQRANLKHKIQISQDQKIHDITQYGNTKGSQGYGNKKSDKMEVSAGQQKASIGKKITKQNSVIKFFYLILKEIAQFIRSINHDKNHTRNIMYFWISIYASSDSGMLFNALLLIDIINKIKTLGNVLSIFKENAVALMSTLALFFVLLYFSAFFSFQTFRTDFIHIEEGFEDEAPGINLYCETLVQCLVSTINFGLRAGGGLGDFLDQATWDSDQYWTRYIFDFMFFMVINIILMNIFFGIIIDSFADKRASEAEIESEVQGQCFICGISKSTFEIENVPWKDHIFQQHNMHAYLSFIIHVKQKRETECTGIEKYVKHCLDTGIIIFFPINRCLAINGGETME